MKIAVRCHECLDAGFGPRAEAFVDLSDNGKHEVTCKLGHRVVVVLQNPRFELLMDSGALA